LINNLSTRQRDFEEFSAKVCTSFAEMLSPPPAEKQSRADYCPEGDDKFCNFQVGQQEFARLLPPFCYLAWLGIPIPLI
jgi:hypothetical protein